ncbi:MAG: hypothetical protein PHY48_14225, partial [Candidatus Cloacimonetes bacterium]|nr:hypothetical protein [Candidatus Cloacimonadota bacterium]
RIFSPDILSNFSIAHSTLPVWYKTLYLNKTVNLFLCISAKPLLLEAIFTPETLYSSGQYRI